MELMDWEELNCRHLPRQQTLTNLSKKSMKESNSGPPKSPGSTPAHWPTCASSSWPTQTSSASSIRSLWWEERLVRAISLLQPSLMFSSTLTLSRRYWGWRKTCRCIWFPCKSPIRIWQPRTFLTIFTKTTKSLFHELSTTCYWALRRCTGKNSSSLILQFMTP